MGRGSEPLRVVVVDDDASIRKLVRATLEDSDVATVVAEADGDPDQVAAACGDDPNVVLLDQNLGGRRGTELIGDIVRACPRRWSRSSRVSTPPPRRRPRSKPGRSRSYEKSVTTPTLPQHLAADHALFGRALAGEDVYAPSAADRRRASR